MTGAADLRRLQPSQHVFLPTCITRLNILATILGLVLLLRNALVDVVSELLSVDVIVAKTVRADPAFHIVFPAPRQLCVYEPSGE